MPVIMVFISTFSLWLFLKIIQPEMEQMLELSDKDFIIIMMNAVNEYRSGQYK